MYEAIITRAVNVRKHPNADRLQIATALGFQVIVGTDIQDGDLGVLFPPDGQLSEEFCNVHGLVGSVDPDTGKHIGGFFGKKRRVMEQNFRGVKSEGFWVPASHLLYTGFNINSLKEGQRIKQDNTSDKCFINNHHICNKYYNEATLNAVSNSGGRGRRYTRMFVRHVETQQFRFVLNTLPSGLVIITEKLHGTSGRTGRVLDEVKLTCWQRLVNKIHPVFKKEDWTILSGTRNVILTNRPGAPTFYDDESFRAKAEQSMSSLPKGLCVYYEIVGYHSSGLIMPEHDTASLKNKELKKMYGGYMRYTYGCGDGESETYVYRMTITNEDGYVVEVPWFQVKQICRTFGLKHVPELTSLHYRKESSVLQWNVEEYMQGCSVLDDKHIKEGVVVRVEGDDGVTYFAKQKQHDFLVLEGIAKEDDSLIDMEEVS